MKTADQWIAEFGERNEGPKNAPCLSDVDIRAIQADVFHFASRIITGHLLSDAMALQKAANAVTCGMKPTE